VITLRRAETDADLEAWRSVRIDVEPNERTAAVEEIRRRGTTGDRLYLLAELDGVLAGCGFAGRSDLGNGNVMPLVLAEHRGRGVGTAILEALVDHVAVRGFPSATAHVDGHDERSVAFATCNGFHEFDRQVEMVRALDAEAPPPAPPPFDGVEFVTVEDRGELLEQAYDLACEGYADLKLAAGTVSVSLEEWLRDEATLPGGSFVALHGDDVVGYAGLMAWPDDPTRAEHGLTVVRRAWRRRGLATALKAREVAWAAASGLRELVTWTQTGNEALQGVNARLGYTVRSVSLSVRRELG
jgi:GNAT superfamily N-acetyltransferase